MKIKNTVSPQHARHEVYYSRLQVAHFDTLTLWLNRSDLRVRDGARHAALHREQNAGLCYSAPCQNIKRFAHKAAQFDSETIAPKDTIFGTETT